MDNLGKKYQKVVIKSLIKILIKFIFLKKYFTIFPYLGRLNVELSGTLIPMFVKDVQGNLGEINSILLELFTTDEQQELLKSAILEVVNKIDVGSVQHSIFTEFLNSLSFTNCESSNTIDQPDNNKYTSNTLILERFCKIVSQTQTIYIALDSASAFFATLSSLSDDEFNSNFLSIEAGLRILYIPLLNLPSEQIQIIQNDSKAKTEKINYMNVKIDGVRKIFFPLLLTQTTIPLDREQIVNLQSNEILILNLKSKLIESEDFVTLFKYIFPLFALENLLVCDFLEQFNLLMRVYEKNKIYSISSSNDNTDFCKDLITMIQKIASMEKVESI